MTLSAKAKGQLAAKTHKVTIKLSAADMTAVRTGKAAIFRPWRDNWPIGTLLLAEDSQGKLIIEIKNKKPKQTGKYWQYDVEADA